MLKSIGLAKIELDGRHVSGLRYGLDDARIAAALILGGVSAKLYSGKSEGRALDLVRQLIRMRVDSYMFMISSETIGATCQLVRGLKELRPDLKFLFRGRMDGANQELINEIGDLGTFFPEEGLDNVLKSIFEFLKIQDSKNRADPALSPYLSELLTSEYLIKFGIAAGQDMALLTQELQWISEKNFPQDSVIPIDASTLKENDLIEICKLIGKNRHRFSLQVEASSCSKQVFAAMPGEKIARLIIKGQVSISSFEDVFDKRKIVLLEDNEQLLERAALYGNNGTTALHTGSYFDAKQLPGIYHLEVPLSLSADEKRKIYSWAAPNMDIRSAVVLKGPTELVAERLPDLVAPQNLETGGWPKHSYAIETNDDSSNAHLIFDGNTSTRQAIRYVPLSELTATPLDEGVKTFVTMNTSEDADELVMRLERFHRSGDFRTHHPRHAVFFENSCRWGVYGHCRLTLLRRIEVNQSMSLSSCRDAGQVGMVGDSFDQLAINVKQRQQMEEVRRNCASCAVRDTCSHCSQLPESWGGRYCEIRKRYPHTSFYFELSLFAHLIAPLLKDVADDHLDLKVSYCGLPMQHYMGATGEERGGARPIIVSMLSQYIVWWRGTRKLSRLSAPLALMAEAWWSGALDEDVVQALIESFCVDRETATSSFAEGMAKLKSEGVVNA